MITDIYFYIKKFVSAKMIVEGHSMWPLIRSHDFVYVEPFRFFVKGPRVGDIVVIIEPTCIHIKAIKRIIAGPYDEILLEDGDTFVNQKRIAHDIAGFFGDVSKKNWILADQEYFLIGDNPGLSIDSRHYGPVLRENIINRVWMISSPVNGIKRLDY